MPSDQIGVRMPETLLAQLRERGDEVSATLRRDLDRYYYLLERARRGIRLSPEETAVIVDALNGSVHGREAQYALASIEDSIRLDGSDKHHGADGPTLMAKLREMTDAEIFAIVDRVERFWQASGDGERHDFAAIFPAI